MHTRTVARGVVGVAVACALTQGWLLWSAGTPLLSSAAVDEAFPIVPIAVVVCAGLGAAIVTRLPSNRIGWLLLLQVGVGVGLVAGQLARSAGSPVPNWVGGWAALISKVFGVPWALGCLALLFLLVPDGRPWSRRWRAAVGLVGAFYAFTVASVFLLGPVPSDTEVSRVAPGWLVTINDVGQYGIALSLVPALVCLLLRTGRATGVERRQLTWVLVGAAALLLGTASYLGYVALGGPGAGLVWVELLFHAGYMAVPVCAGVAVLKYHLYDADRAVSRGVRLAVVTVLVTAGYVVAVTVLETVAAVLLPTRWSGLGASVGAFVLVVVALQPLQGWLRQLADRVVYGARAAPYQALAAVIGGLPDYGSPRELLTRVADAAAAAVDGTATVSVLLPGGVDLRVMNGDPGPPPEREATAAQTWPIRHGGQTVGRLRVVPGAAGLSADQRQLLAAFTDEAGLAFHNAWLQAELAARAETLAADTATLAESRRRLALVGYAERDRLAATIHRDVIVHLSRLEDQVTRIRQLLPEQPADAAGRLEHARAEVNTALDELRRLTRGLYPAVLTRRGLTAAIRSAASVGAATAQLETRGPVDQLPEEVATTAYFATVDSLRDLGGARRAVLAVDQGWLRIDIAGTPRSQPSLAAVRDRVEAMGGTVESFDQEGSRHLIVVLLVDRPTRVASATS